MSRVRRRRHREQQRVAELARVLENRKARWEVFCAYGRPGPYGLERCTAHHNKVVFDSRALAERAAAELYDLGNGPMQAYRCVHADPYELDHFHLFAHGDEGQRAKTESAQQLQQLLTKVARSLS